MITTTNINLNKLYFKYKALTKIKGEHTFNTLHKMFRQIMANIAAVPCTMGGGANRYLGILVSAAKYNIVTPGAPFVPPPMPGELVMTHFHQAYQELRDNDTKIEKLGFQSANAIVEQIVERLIEYEENEEVVHLILRKS